MFDLRIIGLEEGKHPFEIVSEEEYANGNEFKFKNIVLSGEVVIFSHKFEIKAKVSASIDLICDRSGKEFTQELSKDLDLVFKFSLKEIELLDDDIEKDLYKLVGNKVDLTKLIIEELILEIPLKKISPEYQGIEFENLYPKYAEEKNVDSKESPWNELKKLNFN